VGTLDSSRAEQLTERILGAISEAQAETLLLDITGVPAVDTRTAQHLIDTVTAARLLGATVVLTGVRPAIAQTLVQLGIDLAGMRTNSSVAAGLNYAIERAERKPR
jgi:rsbT co-antagonist protein RsbR